MKNYLTADIGACTVELASTGNGKGSFTHTPNNLVSAGSVISYDAMAEHISETLKAEKIGAAKEAAVVLPASRVSVRMITMPAMRHEELMLNLPYEFREYVGNDEKEYVYDYAVMSTKYAEDGKPLELNLLAAAVKRSVIKDYTDMFKAAGLKLAIAAPEEMGYCNLLRHYIEEHPDESDDVFFIVDLGHTATRIHVLYGDKYTFSRTIDMGGQDIDMLISTLMKVDEYVAHEYKENNYDGCQSSAILQELYDRVAIEIMRAVNFFQYSNAGSKVDKIYLCGGGRNLEPLMDTILRQNDEVQIEDVTVLYPKELRNAQMPLTPAALGVAML